MEERAMETEIAHPLVFQCANCRAVVGDSLAFHSSDEELNCITLTRANGIVYDEDQLQVCLDKGKDKGSTYSSFHCETCETVLGKVYITTSKLLDDIRDHFTFSVEKVLSYELGTGTVQSSVGVCVPSTGHDEITTALQDELLKIQQLYLVQNERLVALETLVSQPSNNDSSNTSKKRKI